MSQPQEQTHFPEKSFDLFFTPKRFAFLLALLFSAVFPDVLFGTKTFVFRDFGFFAHPLAHFHREAFWRGEIPLWNPLNYCGIPFLAQWNSLTLYPLSAIYLLFPLSWSVNFFCIFHLFLGGLGMYYLARRWTGNDFAASVAGVAFAFNGLSLNFLMWTNNSATFGWMPWVVLTAETAIHTSSPRRLSIAILVGALQMLAAGPEIILLTWTIIFFLFLVHGYKRTVSWKKIFFYFFAVVAGISALCAAQLLPFLELLKYSHRDANYASASDWAMPTWGWANLIVPLFRNYSSNQGVWFQPGQQWTSSYYPGIGIVFLALLAILRRQPARVTSLTVLLFFALAFALGDGGVVLGWLWKVFPALGMVRYPIKFVTVANWALPLLAAFALAKNESDSATRSYRRESFVAGVILTLVATTLWIAHAFPLSRDNWAMTVKNGLSCSAVLIGIAASVVVIPRSQKFKTIGAISLLFLIWLDIKLNIPNQNPTTEREVLESGWVQAKLQMKPQPKNGETRAMLSPVAERELREFRISDPTRNYMLKRLALFADANLVDDLPKINGFFSLYPNYSHEVFSVIYAETNHAFNPLMDFLSVSQISSPTDIFAWTNRPSFLPMATMGQKPAFLSATNTFRALFQTNVDFRKLTFLPTEARAFISVTNETDARIVSAHFRNQKIVIETDASETSLLTISQSDYPAWRAHVDSIPARIWRANYAFQAIEVPAGKHTVVMEYRDRTFYAGATISFFALTACVAGLAKRERKSS